MKIDSQGFLKLNVTISKETAKEISSGNFPALTRFLLDLQKRFLPKVKIGLISVYKRRKMERNLI